MENIKSIIGKDKIWRRVKKYIALLLFFVTVLVLLLFSLLFLNFKIYFKLNTFLTKT